MNLFSGKKRNLLSAVAVIGALTGGTAVAGTFNLDGGYNPLDDGYTHEFTMPLQLDTGASGGTTKMKVGIGVNNNLFVYVDVPLALKDTTWGTGTHTDYVNGKDVVNGRIAMNQNTGSEKIKFNFGSAVVVTSRSALFSCPPRCRCSLADSLVSASLAGVGENNRDIPNLTERRLRATSLKAPA